jgi:hypothetical protein
MAGQVWHLGTSNGDYFRISDNGASAPTVEQGLTDIFSGGNTPVRVLWSNDGGATLWAGCGYSPSGHALVKSIDSGLTWVSQITPTNYLTGHTPGNDNVLGIWGDGADVLVISIEEGFATDDIMKLNPATNYWTDKATAINGFPHTLFGTGTGASAKIYCGVATGAHRGPWRSLDGGDTWAGPDSGYGQTSWSGAPQLVVDSSDVLYVMDFHQVATIGIHVRVGSWGGPYSDEFIANHAIIGGGVSGKLMDIDEAGNVYAMTRASSNWYIWRRPPAAPGSGVWTNVHTVTGAGTAQGGIRAVNSSNICVTGAGYVTLFDGTTWRDWSTQTDLGLGVGVNPQGVWGPTPLALGVRVPSPTSYLDLVASSAPNERIVLISTYPEEGEGRVSADAVLHGTIASLDNVALAATAKIYVTIDGGLEELVYDQGGTGFQTGWDGAGSSATVRQSPGSGVNDELVYAIDRTTSYPSRALITVRVEASTA